MVYYNVNVDGLEIPNNSLFGLVIFHDCCQFGWVMGHGFWFDQTWKGTGNDKAMWEKDG